MAAQASIVFGQIGYLLVAYWARVETFVSHPGRFRGFEVLLGSDLVVFGVPFGVAIVCISAILSRRVRIGLGFAMSRALLLAVIGEFIALVVAFNTWGS